jgi:hypothetical protein
MNHEFEWRNQMRKLAGPVEPARDLWPAIAARLADAPEQAPPRRWTGAWMALAATVLVAVGAGGAAWRWQLAAPVAPPQTIAQQQQPAAPVPASAAQELPRTALDWAMPADPALAASARNLDNASAQLQQALEQRPDAVFLVGLLNRTNAQRLRLMRKSPYSG